MPAINALIELSGDVLPGDALVSRYQAREALSTPYEIEVEFSTEDASFVVDACMRKRLLLQIVDADDRRRNFDGLVDRAEFRGLTDDRFAFRVRLRPSLAALAHREGSRIFQDMTIIDVVKKVLKEAGIDDEKVDWQIYNSYESKEYITQYRESELDFVHRLLEDDGIFYFFRHTIEGHKLVIADHPDAFKPHDDAPEVAFAMATGLAFDGEPLADFSRTRSLRTNSVQLRDYDFQKPNAIPTADAPADDNWTMPLYIFPGGFKTPAAGKRRAMARLSERRRDADTCRGTSEAIGLRCGVPFTVEGAEPEWMNGEYVVTELLSYGEQHPHSPQHNFACHNAFTGIPAGAPWAPPRVTKKPKIRGIQTAIVTGPSHDDQAIHCDAYGRVKVRFHWDREGGHDEKTSCWLRVWQLPTGGNIVIPRVDWEMAVGFFEGSPDKPYVIGRLYNGEKKAPYALPGASASGSLKSHSTPGGAGHNEIKMADSGGSQGYGIHAQKDLNISIGHDKKETVAVDEVHNVTINLQSEVGSNEKIQVGVNQTVTVGAVASNKVGGSQTIKVGAIETDNATSNYVENIGGNREYTVAANQIIISNGIQTSAAGAFKRTVGAVQLVGAVGSISDNIGGDLTESIGAVKLVLAKGKNSETVGANKSQTYAAAEVHIVSGKVSCAGEAAVTQLIGGLRYQKVAGDYTVKAPIITLVGATGTFKGGGSSVKLGGGPVVITGSKIAIEAPLIVKLAAGLKMGA